MSKEENIKPIVFLLQDAHIKLKYFIDNVDGEISGLGSSYVDKNENIVITDLILFKQTCTSASTKLDNDAQAKFLFELTKKKEDPSKWNVWWHSHARMGVYWSTVDTGTIDEHIGTIPYLVSLVANKKGEVLGRLDVFPTDTSPFSKRLIHTDDELTIIKVQPLESQTKIKEITDSITELEEEIEKIEEECFVNDVIEKFCLEEIKDKITDESTQTKTYNNASTMVGVTSYNKYGFWRDGKFTRWENMTDADDDINWDAADYSNYDTSQYENEISRNSLSNTQLNLFEDVPPGLMSKDDRMDRFEFCIFIDLILSQSEYIYDEIEQNEIGFRHHNDDDKPDEIEKLEDELEEIDDLSLISSCKTYPIIPDKLQK